VRILFIIVWYILIVLIILVSVIFTTLLERKILGFSQNRLGVNKVGYFSGLIQSVLDGIKLIKKQVFLPFKSKAILLVLSPIILIVLILVLWITHVTISFYENFSFFFLFNICCIGLRVYSSLILRWRSNSKYRRLAIIRRTVQTLSYEIVIAILFLIVVYICHSLNQMFFCKRFFILILPTTIILYITIIVEMGRAPFDLLEGESELVRGFNIEIGETLFAILFIGEYGIIIYFCPILYWITNLYFIVLVAICYLIRSSFPRIRYDFIIYIFWYKILPITIILIVGIILLCF